MDGYVNLGVEPLNYMAMRTEENINHNSTTINKLELEIWGKGTYC